MGRSPFSPLTLVLSPSGGEGRVRGRSSCQAHSAQHQPVGRQRSGRCAGGQRPPEIGSEERDPKERGAVRSRREPAVEEAVDQFHGGLGEDLARGAGEGGGSQGGGTDGALTPALSRVIGPE